MKIYASDVRYFFAQTYYLVCLLITSTMNEVTMHQTSIPSSSSASSLLLHVGAVGEWKFY